jgi:DNA-binding beta-propeller fold protein YncE
MMARKALVLVALALVLTCAPSALPRSESGAPTATTRPIDSSDLITLREGGRQPALVTRKVATGEAVRSLPDGVVLPDGVTILSIEADGGSTIVKKVDRRSGKTTTSNKVEGVWQFYLGMGSLRGASPDGTHVVLYGSSYNFTDQSGTWVARTTFGVLDVSSLRVDRIQLDGHYGLDGVSNDGRFVYLVEYVSAQSPDSRLRVYDMKSGRFDELAGDLPALGEAYRKAYIGASSFALMSTTESVRTSPDMIQVMPVTNLIRLDLSLRAVRLLRLPITRALIGEDVLMWSLVPSRDQKLLYVVNPAAGAAYEIDAGSLEIRRSAQLNDAKSQRGVIDTALAYLHPIAEAKMGFGTPAVMSPDGSTLYVLAAQGIWSFDLTAFKAKLLAREGSYETIAISPDGGRLYVLGREDGLISAVDAKSGKLLGSMTRIAFPSEIVAVDAG